MLVPSRRPENDPIGLVWWRLIQDTVGGTAYRRQVAARQNVVRILMPNAEA